MDESLTQFQTKKRVGVIGGLSLAVMLGALLGYAWWPLDALPAEAKADAVLVFKADRKLQLLRNQQVLKTYRIALGQNPVGHKMQEGDERTPEGQYKLDFRNPRSIAHRALHISYPNAADVAQAQARGVLPGGAVMIHGLPNKVWWLGRWHRWMDWTDGCIGVTNAEMDEIWRVVPTGTPIEIRP